MPKMTKKDKVVDYPDSIDTRVALLEASISTINQTLIRMEAKMDKQFDDIKLDIREIRRDSRSDFKCLLSMIIGSTVGITAIMAHGFHWF